jgi:hypothetical protein
MIQVTLQFSTIAAAVSALARIDADAIVAGDPIPHATVSSGVSANEKAAVLAAPAATPTAAPGKPKAVKPATAATPSTAQASDASTQKSEPASPTTPPAAAPAAAPAEKLDYPTLQKAVFKLVGLVKGAGKDPNVEVLGIARELAANDGATFKELPAELWPAALERVAAKTLELEAA